jgi:PAS domain S-box-containing protein
VAQIDDVMMTSYGSMPGEPAADTEGAFLAAGIPCAVLDMPSMRLVEANHAFAALIRLDVTEVKGLDFFTLVPPQNRTFIESVLSGMAAGAIRFFEGPGWWRLPGRESLDADQWLRCVGDDLSPGKAFVVALPAGSPTVPVQPIHPPDRPRFAVGTVDHAWRLVDVSVDAVARLGLDPEQCRGMALHDIVHPDDTPLLLLAAGRSCIDRRGVATTVRVRRHDGEWTPVRCELSPLCGHNPAHFALAMWAPDTAAEEPAAQRAARLEDHLWRIALEVAAAGVGDAPATAETWWSEPALRNVSQRQLEILRRLLRGERVPTIARDLFLSQSTVRNHLSAIYRRVGVHSQAELVARLLPGRGAFVGQWA